MSRERLYLFDTTLRDGAQTQGVDFGVEDKRLITEALDGLGIDYIEGGWPGANPTDTAFFNDPPETKNATFTAFGMTRRSGRSADNDPSLVDVLAAGTKAVCLVGKSWDFQVEVVLGVELDENIRMISESIAHVVSEGREAMLDAEHFFDGYKANPDYALSCLKAAMDAGARWVVLCDTNGGTLPKEVSEIVSNVTSEIPGANLGIHTQNDTENAVANSLAALDAGVRQIQGTLNGLGERCGNANLTSLIPSLVLKPIYADRFETGVTLEKLQTLSKVSRFLDELLNQIPDRHAAYVGATAFAHKGGLHAAAVRKDPATYEHVRPESVGNVRYLPMSDQAGKASLLERLSEAGIDTDPKDKRLDDLIRLVKEQEFLGYSYDGADASFELLARKSLGLLDEYFKVESFRVMIERRFNAKGELVAVSEANVKITVDGQSLMSVGEGVGPVNALDKALRKDLGKYAPYIDDLELIDYKVRILTHEGTEAVTRVMIECADAKGRRWSTVGVSANIVDASFQALYDAVVYKLLKEEAPAMAPAR